MATFHFEVTAHGRLNITVEADTAEEAQTLANNHPSIPDFDKTYDLEINQI